MNKYVKNYLQRGIAFGGFGPIVAGIVFWILHLAGVNVALNGAEAFIAILSTYLLAFVQAGSSVFNQVEGWPIAKSMGRGIKEILIHVPSASGKNALKRVISPVPTMAALLPKMS